MPQLDIRQRIKDHGHFPLPTPDRMLYGCGGFVESRIRNEDTERPQIIPPQGSYMADCSMGWVDTVRFIPATTAPELEHQLLFGIDRKLPDVDWNFIYPHRRYLKRREGLTASRMTSYESTSILPPLTQIQQAEQCVAHQPAISFSISFQQPFNRASGRTSNVLPKHETSILHHGTAPLHHFNWMQF